MTTTMPASDLATKAELRAEVAAIRADVAELRASIARIELHRAVEAQTRQFQLALVVIVLTFGVVLLAT